MKYSPNFINKGELSGSRAMSLRRQIVALLDRGLLDSGGDNQMGHACAMLVATVEQQHRAASAALRRPAAIKQRHIVMRGKVMGIASSVTGLGWRAGHCECG